MTVSDNQKVLLQKRKNVRKKLTVLEAIKSNREQNPVQEKNPNAVKGSTNSKRLYHDPGQPNEEPVVEPSDNKPKTREDYEFEQRMLG